MTEAAYADVPAEDLHANPWNPNVLSPRLMAKLKANIEREGFVDPITVTPRVEGGHLIIDGQHRYEAGLENGLEEFPCIVLTQDGGPMPEERAKLLTMNLNHIRGVDDPAKLAALVDELAGGIDVERLSELTVLDERQIGALRAMVGDDGQAAMAGLTLAERFIVPPFSVLDARQGYWRERKRAWLALGIQGELGRGDSLTSRLHAVPPDVYQKKSKARAFRVDIMRGEAPHLTKRALPGSWNRTPPYAYVSPGGASPGTSVFDPVLCEVAYRWFCPPGGRVLDPFAGGSVRGVVAARLGLRYVGVDLSRRQIEENRKQWEAIGPGDGRPKDREDQELGQARWVVGDSRITLRSRSVGRPDLVFTCPPYYDLERYGDEPADLSNAPTYAAFLEGYRSIMAMAVGRLREDRFAVLVATQIRDGEGLVRDLVGDTVEAVEDAGARLYNEAVLVNAIGSLPVRASLYFTKSRKLGRTHQSVLIFIKGNPRAATEACGPVEVADA